MTHLTVFNAGVYAGVSIAMYTFILISIMNCLRPQALTLPFAWVKTCLIQCASNFVGIVVGVVALGWYDCEYSNEDEEGVIPIRQLALLCIIFSLIATVRIYNVFLCRPRRLAAVESAMAAAQARAAAIAAAEIPVVVGDADYSDDMDVDSDNVNLGSDGSFSTTDTNMVDVDLKSQ
ncbi:hypothetical protein PGAG_00322 [Phaeocystis globosa virus 12T]|uniref:Uncharacterized protein n=1 Tax=Phaeocystis globosa virus PgV-16T TaxID=3071227 RepID=A0AC59EXH3_9VIRU|nr:hypothetical protein PGCG_00361 [Phaeocystis globosa virus]AET73211.1 hypothetical protein PGAG_00322 [Phaeocystis globosa virus 12T]AET74035.1 hypothetical protein PGBG_00327 [Phaeocystis globosa virus 14T]AGM15672.1 hypothetical protein PGCG_00361 [Phaeocystis globosa virus PgV-16T]UYE94402.1 hypothetical protein PGV14T_00361 [Phaeocystis globosa virus]